ncbi:MAG TPA: ABC transporter permease, partial [Bacteroidales bacterium]|nr:ABC transporter permease [Bacteroidales bacterium]
GQTGWPGKYIPGNIVYFNFFLFTVAQVIIAAFLSADFLNRERKMDTTEVFYTRPMSNFQYVTGKTLGALQVFLGLNLAVLLLSLVISLISADVVFVLQPFLVYLFLYSLPSLVFILGFSFILMVLVRNQAVTFVLILGFAGIVLFYLKNMHHGVWDFIGFYLPVHYSGLSGFSNISAILFQRSTFFLLGVLGIFLTAYFLPRLPGHKRRSPMLLLISVGLLCGASFLIFHQISSGKSGRNIRDEIRMHEATLPQIPSAHIKTCHLEVRHSEETITCEATLQLKIDSTSPLLLNLNPGFAIETVTVNQQPAEFTFRHGLLSIEAHFEKASDTLVQCRLKYHGAPDQQTIYPYVKETDRQLLNRLTPLVAGKEHAFVQSNFLLLTRESGWYPVVAWQNFRQQPAFTSYTLAFHSQNKTL